MLNADFIGISRHRLATDGVGVTTLAAFHGCPLRCKYCLNPQSLDSESKRETLTPEELYERLRCDDLYFVSTGGGVTFGGGEPLLRMDFLKAFKAIVGGRWHLTAETSLAVSRDSVIEAAEIFDEFIVDIKDTDPDIYRAYTGKDGALALGNLEALSKVLPSGKILVRLPLIKDYNTESDIRKSEALLRKMDITRFDRFRYRVR